MDLTLSLSQVVDSGADFAIEDNDLATDGGLAAAVMVSLFTDRRVDGERGWWGDAVPVVENDEIGSRLWTLERAKPTEQNARLAEEYSREALQWMIDDRVIDRLEVTASFPRARALGLYVRVARPGEDFVNYQFSDIWGDIL